jgi:hypothetical protein
MSGFVATYSCSSGYEVLGGDHRTCGTGREWLGSEPTCNERLDCACSAAFIVGERITTVVDDSMGAVGLPAGSLGTVLAATTFFGDSFLLVEFDDWFAGHDGNCYNAACGSCVPSGSSRWWLPCSHVASTRLRCACGGSFSEAERVVVLSDDPAFSTSLPEGTVGTVLAGRGAVTGDQILVEWDSWLEGHDGACYLADCGSCSPTGKSRWWIGCDDIRSAQ